MLDENLIATLETSLRQTRNAQNRLMARLRDVEGEAERLRQEIEALDNSAAQTEAAIFSLLDTIRSGKQKWDIGKTQITENIDTPYDYVRPPQRKQEPPQTQPFKSSISYINNSSAPSLTDNKPFTSSITSIERVSNRFNDRTITQACTLLLREANRALHVNELYNYLVAGGMEFKGNNPTISIAVSLNRNRRFRKVAPGTFDLVIRDAAQAAS